MTSSVIGHRLRQRSSRTLLVKISRWFVSLDMPDPRTNWRRMLACVGLVAMIAATLIAALFLLP